MKRSKKRVAYLVGGMEKAPAMGARWRRNLTGFLNELDFKVIDPVLKEQNVQPDNNTNWYATKNSMKTIPQFQEYMRRIIDLDLDIVEFASTHNVIMWDKYAAMGAGSQGEITFGYRLWTRGEGPEQYLIVRGMSVKEVPGWVVGCVQEIFPSIHAFKKFMKEKYAKPKKARKATSKRRGKRKTTKRKK